MTDNTQYSNTETAAPSETTLKPLTAKQERFVDEYMIDLNATQAAIRAGYSENCAAVQGCENLMKPNIQAEIEGRKRERSEKTKIDAAWVLEQAARSFLINAKEIIGEDGEIKQVNAQAARGFLELAGKHVEVKAFSDRVETELSLKGPKDIAEAASDTEAADAYLDMLRH